MWIIKLGGSLLSSGSLKKWLSIIVRFGAGKLVIVPGGGIFADQVRALQQNWQFDDKAAHQMALLAMEQYAHLLRSYFPDLSLSDSIDGIQKATNSNQIPVWLPFKMVNQCKDLSTDWNLTSDSLSIWLAEKLNSEHTILVKSLSARNLNARQLSDSEMVDKEFPEFMRNSKTTLWWFEPNDMETFEELLKSKANLEDYLQSIAY